MILEKLINIGYAEQNGWPYYSIGSYLIEKNYITKDEMSVQAMKEFFKANPKIMNDVFNSNPSYVFFRITENGATGALNTTLTAKRNLAVDRSYIPLRNACIFKYKKSSFKRAYKSINGGC